MSSSSVYQTTYPKIMSTAFMIIPKTTPATTRKRCSPDHSSQTCPQLTTMMGQKVYPTHPFLSPNIFVISPKCKHDHHSVCQCQGLIAVYLKSIQYNATVFHEFTDSFSAQYKGRHCLGDVSFSVTDWLFYYSQLLRDFACKRSTGWCSSKLEAQGRHGKNKR